MLYEVVSTVFFELEKTKWIIFKFISENKTCFNIHHFNNN